MLSKFLDPKNDICFKRVFGSEKNKDILIHFLNDMLEFKEHLPIKEVKFLKTIQDPEIAAHKTSIVDVLCTDEKKNQYIVEIQVAKEKGFEKRAQYYAAKAYISQMHKGGSYEDLKEVIFLAIADFVIFPDKKSYKSDHVILDRHTYENDLKIFSFTFLELPKFNKKISSLKSMTDKWAYFFKYAENTTEEEVKKLIKNDNISERLYKELNRFSWNDTELLTYDQSKKYADSYLATIDYKYNEGLEKGKQQGLEEGMEKGKQKGLEEGMERGKQQGIEESKIEIAKNMLSLGIDEKIIKKITGLSLKQIEDFLSK